MIEELENRLESAAKDMAEKESRIYYDAAKQKAEGIIFVRDSINEIPSIEDEMKFSFGFKYKVCNRIDEVKQARAVFDTYEYVEIAAYMHRIAEETENFDEFERKLKHEHPSDLE